MAVSYTNNDKLEGKVKELSEAARRCPIGTVEDIQKVTPTGNNVLKCYLIFGIVKECGKQGRKKLYKFDTSKITKDNVRMVYSYKMSLDKRCRKSKDTTVKPIETTPIVETTQPFPSIEDCITFLQFHYGVDVCVIPVKKGYEVESYTLKLK